MDSSVFLLIGKSGAGKSYVGDIIGEIFGWHVYHADKDITLKMKTALNNNKPFTDEMRDDFFPVMKDEILLLMEENNRIVVTQAVYKQKHRDYLCSNIPNLEVLWVKSSEENIFQRLLQRKGGIGTRSASTISSDFEEPNEFVKTIANNGSKENVINQLRSLLKESPNKQHQLIASTTRFLCYSLSLKH